MPDCATCTHPQTVHSSDGLCGMDGCACDQFTEPPNVTPPVPGCCIHLHSGGAIWAVADFDEVEEDLGSTYEGFVRILGCRFNEQKQYETYKIGIRPMYVMDYHEFSAVKWEDVLKQVGIPT